MRKALIYKVFLHSHFSALDSNTTVSTWLEMIALMSVNLSVEGNISITYSNVYFFNVCCDRIVINFRRKIREHFNFTPYEFID